MRVKNEIIAGWTNDECFSSHGSHGLCPRFVPQFLEASDRENSTRVLGFGAAVFAYVGFQSFPELLFLVRLVFVNNVCVGFGFTFLHRYNTDAFYACFGLVRYRP